MSDPESSEATPHEPPRDNPKAAPDYSGNALRREPATIDATAQDLTEPAAIHAAAEDPEPELAHLPIEPASAEHPFDPIPEAETPAEPEPETTPPPVDRGAPDPRGGILAPALLALVIGAAAGFGGAYALRYVDKSDTKLDLLGERVDVLEQQQKGTAALTTAQADLANRVSAIATQMHDDTAGFATLRGDIERLAAPKSGAPASAPVNLAPLEQKLNALQDKLSSLTAQVGDLGGKVAAQQNQVVAAQHLATQVATAHAGDEAAAIIAGSLLRKAESGAPFADDLTALANHGIDPDKLASLQAAGATGVATPGALSKQFAAETDAVLATAPAPKTHGFLDRLMTDAEGLVRVRKIGDTTGDSLAAQVARVQTALDAGSVDTAYQQWAALPDAAKQKSMAFGRAAKTRIDTIAAARALESDTLASLGKAKS